jgi:hypothetical protein
LAGIYDVVQTMPGQEPAFSYTSADDAVLRIFFGSCLLRNHCPGESFEPQDGRTRSFALRVFQHSLPMMAFGPGEDDVFHEPFETSGTLTISIEGAAMCVLLISLRAPLTPTQRRDHQGRKGLESALSAALFVRSICCCVRAWRSH